MAAPKLLKIYLNDHLAGSVVGVDLARRIAKENPDNQYGREMVVVAEEIAADQRELRQIMDRLGVRQKRTRLAVARVMERAGRLKPNGRFVGYSPLSRLLELEGLVMGITGKLALWRSLERVRDGNPALDEADIGRLIARAESQRERVEALRVRAAAEALETS